jgi:hypothetical protein
MPPVSRYGAGLPRRLGPAQTEAERAKWRIVRLDTMAPLPGEILEDPGTGDRGPGTGRR